MARTINIEDIEATVTCLECNKTFPVQMSKPSFQRLCRCGRGMFHFTVSGHGGTVRANIKVHVVFEYSDTRKVAIEPNQVRITE